MESFAGGCHADFRLFMSAEPAATPAAHIIPQGILESSIKITNEPPTGMQVCHSLTFIILHIILNKPRLLQVVYIYKETTTEKDCQQVAFRTFYAFLLCCALFTLDY